MALLFGLYLSGGLCFLGGFLGFLSSPRRLPGLFLGFWGAKLRDDQGLSKFQGPATANVIDALDGADGTAIGKSDLREGVTRGDGVCAVLQSLGWFAGGQPCPDFFGLSFWNTQCGRSARWRDAAFPRRVEELEVVEGNRE